MQAMTNIDCEKFGGKRLAQYANGVVVGKFRECDKKTLEALRLNIPYDEVKRVILEYYKSERDVLKAIEDPDSIRQQQLQNCNFQIEQLKDLKLEEWLLKNQSWISCTLPRMNQDDFIGFIYIYYAYEEYCRKKDNILNSKHENIDKLYAECFDKSSQFMKYGLLPIDDQRKLLAIDPPRIYDSTNNKTLFVKNIPLSLCVKFNELIDTKQIQNLAVRVFDKSFNGKMELVFSLEEIERGRIFLPTNLGIPKITKLYSKNYEDCLWITVETQDITFEELCRDFKIFEDKIVTQVVHLQYKKSDEGIYIIHLDHEYIFYTIDEFDSWQQNPSQKGTAETRMKTFKIDNAYISFDLSYQVVWKDINGNKSLPVSVPFICYVLGCYFQHKDLLIEYFQSVIKL